MKTLLLKSRFLIVLLAVLSTPLFAQKKLASPRDSVKGKIGNATVNINYGSPSVKGRTIWGDLVPYGKVWRAGANEATVFSTDKDLTVEGKTLKAGTYGFFVIPEKDKWTIIFNKTAKQWGAYEYKEKDDALRVTVSPVTGNEMSERLVYKITPSGISLVWEKLSVPVSMK
ncbi:MAG: DUF2911 domain-containing protein [Bacteroidia bacterium]|nr:DUF2911 domain-containing protein [Bacteroidia bacterium]